MATSENEIHVSLEAIGGANVGQVILIDSKLHVIVKIDQATKTATLRKA